MSGSDELVLKTLMGLKEDIGEMRAEIRQATDSILTHKEDDASFHGDMRRRLEKLEREHTVRKGFVAGVSAVVSSLVTALGLWFAGGRTH